ncbi:MAG TPA: response regulator [Candidatus Koribacter sp.]|jgi:CheY-like chemotaxis protein
MHIFAVQDVLNDIKEKLTRPGLDIRLQIEFADYVPPLILSTKANKLLGSAAECFGDFLDNGDAVLVSAFYQDRLERNECCVVLSLQQRRKPNASLSVTHSWLEHFGDLRDELLAHSVGVTIRDTASGLNLEFRLPVYDQKMKSLQHRNTIVLVEDDRFVRDSSREVLEAEGFTVETFGSAEEAKSYLDRHADCVSLVISDLRLPGQDGHMLAAKVHRMVGELPVLLTSGYGMSVEDDLIHHTYFLAKPYNAEMLLAAVRRCLQTLHLIIPAHLAAEGVREFAANGFC